MVNTMNEDEQNSLKDGPIFGGGIDWDWQRILSLVVAAAYLVIGVIAASEGSFKDIAGMVLVISVALILPLACIWFADEMGDYTGSLSSITKLSPGFLIRIGGWILLFLPVIRGAIIWWIDSGLRR